MGSGKSTIGRGLAGSYNCRFIDLDHYMEDKWAMSVSAIFAKNGYSRRIIASVFKWF